LPSSAFLSLSVEAFCLSGEARRLSVEVFRFIREPSGLGDEAFCPGGRHLKSLVGCGGLPVRIAA